MTTKVLDLNNIERKLFWLFSAALLAGICFYVYSLLVLTVSVVDRDHMAQSSTSLENHVSEVEAEYMKLSNTVTLARAEELGLHEVAAKFADNQAATFSMAR